ncbi:hypothetical protein BJ878DRAFT_420511 [Calycina marina]|uniref:SAP domain-containing protein n=1 Tax=Calycina marina TaxID=1763456 RepID=A0A9P7Z3X3_9HELO|nr:hypothetical protein BJ878DRAFT_420511 [Calycina marina]
MSRVTPPVTKLTSTLSRSLHTISDLRNECARRSLDTKGDKLDLADRLTEYDFTPTRDYHTERRPQLKPLPLMQGFRSFRTSPPVAALADTSTIDYFIMPIFSEAPSAVEKMRVPLLPDNYKPNRSPGSAHAIERFDIAVPRPEISVVAAHPEMVLPAMLSEVVGNEGDEMDVGMWTRGFTAGPESWASPKAKIEDVVKKEAGVLKELLNGVVDDIFGAKNAAKHF